MKRKNMDESPDENQPPAITESDSVAKDDQLEIIENDDHKKMKKKIVKAHKRSALPTTPLFPKKKYWKFFNKIDHFNVLCPKENGGCDKKLKWEDGFTTKCNLTKHSCYKEWKKKNNSKNNSTIPDYFGKKIDKELRDKIDILVCKVICLDDRPISMVETPSFKNLCNALNPSYVVHSYKKNMEVMKSQFEIAQSNLIKELADVEWLSLNVDLWTSMADDHFLVLNSNYFKSGLMKQRLLRMISMEEIHCTHEIIQISIENTLNELKISKSKIVAVTSDGGSNIVKAIESLNFNLVHCAGHVLNLIVKDSLDVVADVRSRCRNICSYFDRSIVAWNTLKKYQKDLNLLSNTIHKIVNEVSTRFNSTVDMLERLCLIEKAIDLSLTELKKESLKLDDEEKKMVSEIVEILKPFRDATLNLGSSTSTINEILPEFCSLYDDFKGKSSSNEKVQIMIETLRERLKEEIKVYVDGEICSIASYLDPAYSSLEFLEDSERKSIKLKIKNLVDEIKIPEAENEKVEARNEKKTNKFKKPKLSDAKKSEMEFYEELSAEDDPITFWTTSADVKNIKRLKQVALKYLSVQSTEFDSERSFSAMGRIVTKLRSSLKPENVSMINFLDNNSDLW